MKTETPEETCCECTEALGVFANILGTTVETLRSVCGLLMRHEETLKKHSELLNERSEK